MYFAAKFISPVVSETTMEPIPEQRPFMVTIWYVLLSEILRVQLFSSPQQMVAPRTKMEPIEKLNPSTFSNERMKLDVVINKMAIHKREDTFSLKMNSAINVVATISKFPSREALLDVPYLTPNMSSMGATMSSRTMPSV